MKYYTPIDRFINRFKRRGFLIYSTIVIVSTLYIFYSISHLSQLPESDSQRYKKKKGKERDVAKSRKKRTAKYRRSKKEKNCDEVNKKSQPNTSHPDNFKESQKTTHVVDTWSKKQLYSYLTNKQIYPTLDEDIDSVRIIAKAIYDQ